MQCGTPSFAPTDGLREACQTALNSLPAWTFPQAFGAKGTAGAQIELPVTYSDGERFSPGQKPILSVDPLLNGSTAKSRCFVTANINGPPVAANWYDIWASAIAVMGMCVVDGKAGISTTQGERRALFLAPNTNILILCVIVGGSRISVRMQISSGSTPLSGTA